ncbi:MAG: PAS domain S-box protein, partial [Myxococcota bacterium]
MSTEQRPTAPGAERPAEDADFANAADPCCELDPDGRITRGNRALANVLGHAPETLRGVRLSELIHPDDRALAEGRIGRLDPWIRAAEFTVRLRCASGAYRWLAWTLWRDGDRPGLSGRAEDVTPEREDDLQRHTFFNQSRDMLCLANTDGYFLRINPAFHHILGRSEEELLSRQFLDWVHPDDIGPTQDALVDLADGDQIIGFENRYQISDGSYRWLHWMSVANVADGTVYAVARDITEHKQAQRDLTAATAAAEAANPAKSAVQATKSHQLRTPLNAILGYA